MAPVVYAPWNIWGESEGVPLATLSVRGFLVFCHLNMAQSAISKQCPFCEGVFLRLGSHLKYCPERQGQEYDYLLSQKTIQNREGKRSRTPCPNCGKLFARLDTHLRTSAICQNAQPNSAALSQPSRPPLTQEEAVCPPTGVPSNLGVCDVNKPPYCPKAVDFLPNIELPRKPDEWKKANNYFQVHLVPNVCMRETVDDMNATLCKGIYGYFAQADVNKIPANQHLHQHLPGVH